MYFCIATVPKVLEEYKVRACIQFRKFIILANHAFIKTAQNVISSLNQSCYFYDDNIHEMKALQISGHLDNQTLGRYRVSTLLIFDRIILTCHNND